MGKNMKLIFEGVLTLDLSQRLRIDEEVLLIYLGHLCVLSDCIFEYVNLYAK